MFEALTPLQMLLIITAGIAAVCYSFVAVCMKVMVEGKKVTRTNMRPTLALLLLAVIAHLYSPAQATDTARLWGTALLLTALAVQLPLWLFQTYYEWKKRAYDHWEARYLSKLDATDKT